MSRKIYKRKADVMMLTSQLCDRLGNRIVDISAMENVCKNKICNGQLLRYAYIVHDSDVVTQSDIDERESQRNAYTMRLYREYRSEDLLKQDVQSVSLPSGLDADDLRKACEECDRKLPSFVLGNTKNPHLHLVLQLPTNRRVDEIVGWFNDCFPQMPDLVRTYKDNRLKSGDRITNALGYLVHKNDPSKYQYLASSVIASFDYEKELSVIVEIEARHSKYHYTADDINDIINSIAKNEFSLRDWLKTVPYSTYLRNRKLLDDAELSRQIEHVPFPKLRHTYYFESTCSDPSGTGKSVASYEYARYLAIKYYGADKELFSNVSAIKMPNPFVYTASSKKAFQGYKGQPILVLDDVYGTDMKKLFDGQRGIKTFLDAHPASGTVDVKFSDVLPVVEYVLISGITDFDTFVNDMATSKHNDDADDVKTQFYRRIWGVFTVAESKSDIVPDIARVMVNRDFYPCISLVDNGYVVSRDYNVSIPTIYRSDCSDDEKQSLISKSLDWMIHIFESYDLSKSSISLSEDFVSLLGTVRNSDNPGTLIITPEAAKYRYDGSCCYDVYYTPTGPERFLEPDPLN